MKLLLLTIGITLISISSFCQDNSTTISNDPYMKFRSENMFQIIESSDAKAKGYQVLNVIEYSNGNKESVVQLSPEEFIKKFKNGEIKSENLHIKRSRTEDTWYTLGDTGFVLLGVSENQIANKYNLTIKK